MRRRRGLDGGLGLLFVLVQRGRHCVRRVRGGLKNLEWSGVCGGSQVEDVREEDQSALSEWSATSC